MSAAAHAAAASSLKGDRRLKRKLRELCRTDNMTNFLYIGKVYLVLALTIGATIWFYQFRAAADWSVWWNVPVTFLAILAVGASQHQLAGAGHEATHHTLFKNRLLNELASDWLCMFPIFSTTYAFRLFHLSHHQFINDPRRDPDFAMLAHSGHWLDFPVSRLRFLGKIASQFLLVGLVKYIVARFKFNAVGVSGASPYKREGESSKLAVRVALLYLLGLLLLQIPLCSRGDVTVLVSTGAVSWLALATLLYFLPAKCFEEARLRPVTSRRATAICRMAYITALLTGVSCVQVLTGAPAWWYFLWLWAVPLWTTFSLFMILRQLIQHGNGDRGWLTNTRVFLVNPFVRYAVFPFGMDYHLPHHMYATVPHYNLPELHRFLLQYPEYAQQGIVVENYVIPKSGDSQRNPTCVEVVGPDYAGRSNEVYIDDSVLDAWRVDERDEILRHSEQSSQATTGKDGAKEALAPSDLHHPLEQS